MSSMEDNSVPEILLRSEQLMLKGIQIPEGRMKPDENIVKQLMESIKRVGLLEPLVVCRPANQMGVYLVAGRNRLEACKRLKHKDIACRVQHGDTPEIRQWRELAEIDENLIRRENTPAQRAINAGQAAQIATTIMDTRKIIKHPVLWLAHPSGHYPYHRIQARVLNGVYDIAPCFDREKRNRPFVFVGYAVRFVTARSDDAEISDESLTYAKKKDIRVIATGVQNEKEAKAIAQADADAGRRGGKKVMVVRRKDFRRDGEVVKDGA